MCRRKAGGCLPIFPSPWYKSFWNSPHPSMYHAVEPFPYSGHSLRRLIVFFCWFVSKLLSHESKCLCTSSSADPCLIAFCTREIEKFSIRQPPIGEKKIMHPAVPCRLWLFIANCTSFPARLLPCEDCSIRHVVLLRGNFFAWNSLVCLDIGFCICRFSSMRSHLDQKRCCSCCWSFSELFDCFP